MSHICSTDHTYSQTSRALMTALLFDSQRCDANAPPGVLLEAPCHRCGIMVPQSYYELCHSVAHSSLTEAFEWTHMKWFNHVLCSHCNKAMGEANGALLYCPPTVPNCA